MESTKSFETEEFTEEDAIEIWKSNLRYAGFSEEEIQEIISR